VPAGKNEYLSEERVAYTYKVGETPYFDVMNLGGIRSWALSDE
jgi:hypothetical protein